MKKRHDISIYLFMSTCLFVVFASSCEKDAVNGNNNANTFTDTRDGNVYKIVNIGNQVWMAENLRYLPSVVGPAIGSVTEACYYVYGYEGTNVADAKGQANYIAYGVLYNWAAAKAASPAGWHLPSDAEWTQLTEYLGDAAGCKLKETGTMHWCSPNTGATNETGYRARPGGHRYIDGNFYNVGGIGHWWSATETKADTVCSRYISCSSCNVIMAIDDEELGFSVRCVRD
jgi:uncharacterized protein (TIGR02145 family)